jgi:hypothetical protein
MAHFGRSGRSCGSHEADWRATCLQLRRFSFVNGRSGVAQRSEPPGEQSLSIAGDAGEGIEGKKSLQCGTSLSSITVSVVARATTPTEDWPRNDPLKRPETPISTLRLRSPTD